MAVIATDKKYKPAFKEDYADYSLINTKTGVSKLLYTRMQAGFYTAPQSSPDSLLRDTLFSPVFWGDALYAPPFERPYLLRSAPAFEKIGARLSLPGAGVHVIEATKQLYRPALARRAQRRRAIEFQPALAGGGRLAEGTPRSV